MLALMVHAALATECDLSCGRKRGSCICADRAAVFTAASLRTHGVLLKGDDRPAHTVVNQSARPLELILSFWLLPHAHVSVGQGVDFGVLVAEAARAIGSHEVVRKEVLNNPEDGRWITRFLVKFPSLVLEPTDALDEAIRIALYATHERLSNRKIGFECARRVGQEIEPISLRFPLRR